MPRSLVINSRVTIPAAELQLTFARSAGPGGQNVNKVNSKAVLRWNVQETVAISPQAINRFASMFPTRINQRGEIVISSDRSRDQAQNIANCHEILRDLVRAALVIPRTRKPTRPTRSSIERRLESKQRVAEKKRRRDFRPGDQF